MKKFAFRVDEKLYMTLMNWQSRLRFFSFLFHTLLSSPIFSDFF
jgi:hypothetical protein